MFSRKYSCENTKMMTNFGILSNNLGVCKTGQSIIEESVIQVFKCNYTYNINVDMTMRHPCR